MMLGTTNIKLMIYDARNHETEKLAPVCLLTAIKPAKTRALTECIAKKDLI
jgi:hypothetical protein